MKPNTRRLPPSQLTHGGSKTPEYGSWSRMIVRCYYKKGAKYKNYGGRGILVCDRWRHSFPNFLADMGKRPKGMTIHRKNNDGNYEPDNCIWADAFTQANNKRNNRWITYDGQTKTLTAWAKSVGMEKGTLWCRLAKGWTMGDALWKPLESHRWT